MKITNNVVKSLLCRTCVAIGVATLLYGIPNAANATQLIRELWDGYGKVPLQGKVSDGSSVGLNNSTSWVVSPAGNTGIQQDGSWNIDGYGINGNYDLNSSAGLGGTFAFYGGNMSLTASTPLTNAVNDLPYGNFSSQCYATRALATNAFINLNANGTYYFAVHIFRGYSGWGWNSDTAGGIGLASSSATNADIVGMGIQRNTPFYAANGITDIGNGCYITAGTLNQAGTAKNIDPDSGLDTDGGPYYPRAYGAVGTFTDQAALLVGQLITTAGGAATMNVKIYPWSSTNSAGGPYPSDPSTITWDATYSFTDTNIMTTLLVWQYGGGSGVQDGLRVGTTWADVTGLELTGAIQASPAATVYAGQTVTLSQNAGLNTSVYPMSFQWYSNSVAIVNATNSSLVLASPTTDYTADYTITVSNYYGILTNTPILVTINPAVKPFFTLQPVTPVTAYVGGAAAFTVGVDGTPPFFLQLTHASTNIPGATATMSGSGTATLTAHALTLADPANSYAVVATNQFGSGTSQVATVTLVIPPAGSFEAAALADGAANFWKLSETTNDMTPNGVTLKEYQSGLIGNIPNEPGQPSMTNVVLGDAGPGPVLPGFSGVKSMLAPETGGVNAQINLPVTVYSNQMTFVFWLKAAGGLSGDSMLFNRNTDSGTNGYVGINNANGNLGAVWGDQTTWNSGIVLPGNQWIMVALVIQPNEATLYAGTDPFTLQSVTRSSIEGTNRPNSSFTFPNGRLAVGRTDYSWAVNQNAWGYVRGQYCDVAIFYQALTPAAITNLYIAGFGTQPKVIGTNGGTNTMVLDWYPTLTLQQAGSVAGPYTDAIDPSTGATPTPPYSQPMTNSMQFYRARQ